MLFKYQRRACSHRDSRKAKGYLGHHPVGSCYCCYSSYEATPRREPKLRSTRKLASWVLCRIERADTDAGFRARLPSPHCRSLPLLNTNGTTSICARHGSFARGLLTRRAVRDEHREHNGRRGAVSHCNAIKSRQPPRNPIDYGAKSQILDQKPGSTTELIRQRLRPTRPPQAQRLNRTQNNLPHPRVSSWHRWDGYRVPRPFPPRHHRLGHSLVRGYSQQSNATRTHHGAVDIAAQRTTHAYNVL